MDVRSNFGVASFGEDGPVQLYGRIIEDTVGNDGVIYLKCLWEERLKNYTPVSVREFLDRYEAACVKYGVYK